MIPKIEVMEKLMFSKYIRKSLFAVLIIYFTGGVAVAQSPDQGRQALAELLVLNAGGCMYALSFGIDAGYVNEHDANVKRVAEQIDHVSKGFFNGDLYAMGANSTFLSGWDSKMEVMTETDAASSYPNVLINCSLAHDELLRRILD